MSGFRVKDDDRERFVELIESAYVDGQLGAEDRELRITRARSAATVEELEALTRDLQARPAARVVPHVPVRPPAPSGRPGTWLAVAMAAVAGLLGLGLAMMVLVSPGVPESVTSREVVVQESAPARPLPGAKGQQGRPFEMGPGQVRRFLREYEAKFGSLAVLETVFYPTRVSIAVPLRGSRPRFTRWSYDGTWRRDAEASAVNGPAQTVDLGTIGVSRLFDNVATARKTLRVQRGKLTHVVVHVWDGRPAVNIYIGNSFNESGYLATSMSGEVILRRFAYEP